VAATEAEVEAEATTTVRRLVMLAVDSVSLVSHKVDI
jgi:hypothetical protein